MTERVHDRAPAAVKIALFRRRFGGREDVYARRFESRRTGRAGYSPACANEWVRGLCDKRAVKCAECPSRRFLALTDEVLRAHLTGRDSDGRECVIGVYPMLLDETCRFLAADFDRASWRDDVAAVRETCRRLGVPVMVERSRSGNGAHLWIFFDAPLPAALARSLGAYILTEAMERRPDIGLASYDRFFPNQDTLPRGGFGNLIALPLQRAARACGNSVFVDAHDVACRDQWACLANARVMTRTDVERIVPTAAGSDRLLGVRSASTDEEGGDPWTAPASRRRPSPPIAGPLPACVEVLIADDLYIAKDVLPPALRNRLLRLAAFQNPEFYKAQARRQSTHGIPRIIARGEDHPHHIELPRGCLEDVRSVLHGLGVECVVRDKRNRGEALDVTFQGRLLNEQVAAAEALALHDMGVLGATTAFGKTVVAAWLIARRGVNTLVLVHRRQLMEQWVARLSSFLGVAAKDIGRIGGGRRRPTGRLDVALIQSLVRKGVVEECVARYGHLVVDECHHLPAAGFEQVARCAKARYVLGLSATLTRADGHHPIIMMQCGPVRHRVTARQQAGVRPFRQSVIVRATDFRAPELEADTDARRQFVALCGALATDEHRNAMIVEDVLKAVRAGRSPIVVTERTAHLERLEALLRPAVWHLVVLRGGLGARQLKEVRARLADIPPSEERVILATGRYIGEGFDDSRLDTLFLTMPVSWRGTVAQYAGRLHRLYEGKREVRLYDYADLNVALLARMFDRRCAGYDAIGYTILLPASAVPGWPAEVPLPVEPEWKARYAATVQRLVRDGVDATLGGLFVRAARTFDADAAGEARARSASEAFLFRRLETLPETAGAFSLNAELPIPFDARGRMEVDLLCANRRVAVEIDGVQHLNDAAAYRRDRRKDAALQENGYFVLRFLAGDVGEHLDTVLDAILRTMAHRRDATVDEDPRKAGAVSGPRPRAGTG